MGLQVTEYQKNMYIMDNGRVRCFLFVGDRDALLVDGCFPDDGVYEAAREITELPIKMALTHADGDHTGCLPKAGTCFAHSGDRHMIGEEIAVCEIGEGDIIDVGEFSFEVFHIPGHTYGSIALLDEENDIFITGDSVQKNGPIFMFGKERNLSLYIESLRKLAGMSQRYNRIFPSHNVCPIEKEAVERCLRDALALSEGKLEDAGKHEFMPCHVYQGEYTSYLYE